MACRLKVDRRLKENRRLKMDSKLKVDRRPKMKRQIMLLPQTSPWRQANQVDAHVSSINSICAISYSCFRPSTIFFP